MIHPISSSGEYDGSNQIVARHTHSSLVTDDVLATEVTAQGASESLAQNPGVYTYLKDSLGSIIDIADTSANRLQHYVYSAFGTLLGVQNAMAQDITPSPVLTPYYSFAGREYDGESMLYYNRARYYDPSIGRFLQKDPLPGALGVPMTVVNSYVYAGNNPFGLKDPTGESFLGSLFDVISGSFSVVIAAVLSGLNSFSQAVARGGNFWQVLGSTVLGAAIGVGTVFADTAAIAAGFIVSAVAGPVAGIGVAGFLLAGAGAVGGALENLGNQLIYGGFSLSNINWSRVGNAAENGAFANPIGAVFGYLFGANGPSSAPGQKEALGALGGSISVITGPCPDSGIPAVDPNAGKGSCFGASAQGAY